MKPIHRILSLILATALLLPLIGMLPIPSLAANAAFFSSFEKGDGHNLLQSELDGNHHNAVKSFPYGLSDDPNLAKTVIPDTIGGTPDSITVEGKSNLFDGNADTKFCVGQSAIDTAHPITVSFALSNPIILTSYCLTSANDGEPRDPKNFTLHASLDGEHWTLLDSQTNRRFSGRKSDLTFSLADNTAAYAYYKLTVTATYGSDFTTNGARLFQLGDIKLYGTVETGTDTKEPVGTSPLSTLRSNGPTGSAVAYNHQGYTGSYALRVFGEETAKTNAYARNVIYRDLSIKVGEHTRLSYLIYPDLESSYDYNYTSHYLSIDLKFSDGSYLSDLSAEDQNGFGADPVSQGDSEALFTSQWNYIETNLGKVAKGKTVTEILVYFSHPKTEKASRFLAYFDDITIFEKEETVSEHPSDYVNILRGTNTSKAVSRGITVPLVMRPNGFNAYTPANTADEMLPYYYQPKGQTLSLRHITVNHSASPWLPGANWGVWQMMPNTSLTLAGVSSAEHLDGTSRMATYRHDNEIAKAHHYKVTFEKNDPNAAGVSFELTPTSHAAFVRVTYPSGSDNKNLILGTDHGGRISVTKDTAKGVTVVSGYSEYNQKMYVYSVIDSLCVNYEIHASYAILTFDTDTVGMKLATSYLSEAQAKKNLELEIPNGATFDSILKEAQSDWDSTLSVIEPKGANETELVTLYSSLYRMYCYPLLFSENTGSLEEPVWEYLSPYSGKKTAGKMYTTNGFWDTYRTLWPAMSLLDAERDAELIEGLLCHYRDKGFIARWLGRGGENCMVGTHSDIVLADAFLKGIPFDYETAYESMIKNATVKNPDDIYGRNKNDVAPFLGYVPNSHANGMSWTLEDYINDYGIYRMAKALTKTESDPGKKARYEADAAYFYNRSVSYGMLYNRSVGFFMGKNESGAWTKSVGSFNAYAVEWWGDYAESNAWNLAFPIVYDINGLAALYGGKDKLLEKLSAYFAESAEQSAYTGSYTYEQRETRLGLSMYNNQISLHTAYLFNYLSKPSETQRLTREILSRHYVGSEIGQGLPGDEDNGALSAFYVLCAIGLYETHLGSGEYLITSPLYDEYTLHLQTGDVKVIAHNNSKENIYITSCKINGEAYDKTYIPYSLLTSGNLTIEYEMSATPSDWGKATTSAPSSLSETVEIPEALKDLVQKTAKANAIPETLTEVKKITVYADGITSAASLWDNTSTTAAKLAKGASLILACKEETELAFLTLTNDTKENAPKQFTLEASANGQNWHTLLSNASLDFAFDKQTLPVALPDADQGYLFFRLTFSSAATLAELEWYGDIFKATPDTPITPDPPVTTATPTTTDVPVTTEAPTTPATPTTTDTPVTGETPSGNAPISMTSETVALRTEVKDAGATNTLRAIFVGDKDYLYGFDKLTVKIVFTVPSGEKSYEGILGDNSDDFLFYRTLLAGKDRYEADADCLLFGLAVVDIPKDVTAAKVTLGDPDGKILSSADVTFEQEATVMITAVMPAVLPEKKYQA